jgi:hypothetical protein
MAALTGTERRDEGGDASSGDRRSGKPLSSTFGAEAERLGTDRSADRSEVIRIKTDDAPWEMIDPKGAMPLNDLRIAEPRCRERNRRWRKSHQKKT